MSSIFITGNSNGLGLGLTRHYLAQGNQVYGMSRSACPLEHSALRHEIHDLANLQGLEPALDRLLIESPDLIILNAGILGEIQDLAETSMLRAQEVMQINLWSNKAIIDYLIHRRLLPRQLILVSSGASINGNRGWGAYSLSKAALNMMAKLYAHEMPDSHITAYAPGIIHTRMQDYLCREVDTDRFPSVGSLVQAYQTPTMPDIEQAARDIAASFQRCLDFPSGSFVDIRQL
jgi:NAD(P)-dependent dehydrogenase (short-subunit alcohol dehydrogenase family)